MGQLLLKFISSLLGEWEGGARGKTEEEERRRGRGARGEGGTSAALLLTLVSQWKAVVL